MRLRLGAGAALVALLAACGGAPAPAPPSTTDPVRGDVTVFAAASLTEAFTAAGAAFRKRHPAARATFNFAGTPTLLAQLQQGAADDVFASADQANMQRALDGGLVAAPAPTFTKNRLEIVVAAGNPKRVTGLADLARADLLFITEAPTVPAGKYGAQALAAAGVRPNPRSQETDVKSVVSKVKLGEADAGIVYVTDVKAAGARVEGVPIPDAQNVIATYPIAVAREAHNRVAAAAFIAYLLSTEGQKLFATFGFVST